MRGANNGGPLTITVFMDVLASLRMWETMGMLDRETAVYRQLSEEGWLINLVSYGGRDEYEFAARIPGIRILCNWMGLPCKTYQRRLFQVHALPLLRSQIIKSHNTHGMLAALRAQWAWRIPFVLRMAYFWSISAQANPQNSQSYLRDARAYERKALTEATHIVIATEDQAKVIVDMVPAAVDKITMIPNFVDCDVFSPMPIEKRFDLVYVGRLTAVKNLDAMLEAVERTGATIAIIGGGSIGTDGQNIEPQIESKLKERFGVNNGRIHWLGKIPNEALPAYINQAKALILCSHSEGQPRSMLEAMACGIPVIGSKVGGIASTLRHEETGYLCGNDADSITAAIKSVLARPRLIEEMGANARRFAVDNLSLTQVMRQEFDLLQAVAHRHPVESAPRRVADYVFRKR